jgi:hypothetical protein
LRELRSPPERSGAEQTALQTAAASQRALAGEGLFLDLLGECKIVV